MPDSIKLKKWNLKSYSYLNEDSGQSSQPFQQSSQLQGDSENSSDCSMGEWVTIDRIDEVMQLELRLTDFGHLCLVMQKDIQFSLYLIAAKRWFKAVRSDSTLLFMVRQNKRALRRMQLCFDSDTIAADCLLALSDYVCVKSSDLKEAAKQASQIEDKMNNLTLSNPNVGCSWPTSHLEGFIRTCLKDDNFPSYLAQVQKSLDKILAPIEDED